MSVKNIRALSLVMFFLLASIACGAEAPKANNADIRAGIVLGNFPEGTDEPTNTQTARCLKAFELFKNGTINKLVVSGGFTLDHISEARMMKIALVAYGVPPDDIIEEELSSTTIENASYSRILFDQLNWEKNVLLISQKIHLLRANQIFKNAGFKVKNAPAPEFADRAAIFAKIADIGAIDVKNTVRSELIIVYEPFDSFDPMAWPTPQLARRLRTAAALFDNNTSSKLLLYSDWYARGPVDLAQMMRIAVISLGVPSNNAAAVGKIHYGNLASLVKLYGDKPAALITSSTAKEAAESSAAPLWKFFFID